MLSLNPRYDLVKFKFPKDFLPEDVEEKYAKFLSRETAVINSPIEYLNESIQRLTIPGITDLVITQMQHGSNDISTKQKTSSKALGKINVEPKTDISYKTTENPLDKITKEFKVTFRHNQGYMNYFMLFESIFYRACKPLNHPCDPVFTIELLSETGTIIAVIKLTDVFIDGIDGIELDYSKTDRQADTFDVTFKFNNIDYEFYPDHMGESN